MVQSDVRDDAHDRDHNVGRIQTSAETRFDHRNIHPSVRKVLECDAGRGFEERRVCLFDRRTQPSHVLHQLTSQAWERHRCGCVRQNRSGAETCRDRSGNPRRSGSMRGRTMWNLCRWCRHNGRPGSCVPDVRPRSTRMTDILESDFDAAVLERVEIAESCSIRQPRGLPPFARRGHSQLSSTDTPVRASSAPTRVPMSADPLLFTERGHPAGDTARRRPGRGSSRCRPAPQWRRPGGTRWHRHPW